MIVVPPEQLEFSKRPIAARGAGVVAASPRSRAAAPTLSRSEGRRQTASNSSIAFSVGAALSDEARSALARYSNGSLP